MAKVVKFECVAEEKVFTNKETNESFPYYALSTTIYGQKIKLNVATESKQLFKYLLDSKVVKK